MTLNGQSGSTEDTVRLNAKPACRMSAQALASSDTLAAGCLEVETIRDTYGSAAFTVNAQAYQDDGKLNYEFGVVDAAGVRKSLYTGTSIAEFSSSLMLPEGNNTLYACVSDADGAQACETTVVTVKKDDNFRLSDAVSKFDVGHLASMNDVGVLAAGAAALQSMNAYAQQQAAGDVAAGGNDTSSAAADEVQKKLQEEIDTKAGALINSLAGNADALVSDPQSMQQVISAAAGLSQTSSASSQETQDNLLSIAQAGLQSAQMPNKDITSDQISQIVSVAAVGTGTNKNSGSSSGSSQGSGKPKRLLLSWDGNAAAAAAPASWLGGMRQVLTTLPFSRSNRRLQQDTASPDGSTVTPESSTAASIKGAAILSVMDQAADLLLAQSTPASGLLSTGSQGLCVSVANLLGSAYAEAPLAVGEALEAAGSSSSNKAASTTSPGNVIVEFSSPLLGICQTSDDNDAPEGTAVDASTGCTDSTVSVVLQYYQNATLLLNTDVAAALAAGGNDTNTTDNAATADPLPGLELMSGAVVLAVTGANADDRLPCSNTSSRSSSSSSVENATLPEGCGALLTLPILGELSSSSSKELIVLRIAASGVPTPDGVLLGVANGSTTSITQGRRLLADGATTAQVWTSKSGTFMLGQVTRTGGAPVGGANDTSGSNATAPDNTTACGNATLDANATGCNTTDVNTTISSNTTELNTTNTTTNSTELNTTDTTTNSTDLNITDTTSNTTEPDAPPPSGSAGLSNTTQTNTTAGNDTTISNTTTPGANVTTNTTTPGTNDTAPGADTTTNTTTNATGQPTNQTAPATPPEQQAAASPSPSPSPQQQLGSGAAGPSDTTVALNLTLPMKFSELSSSQSLLNSFKADVAANIAATLGIDATLVEVVNVREGSVECDVIVRVPASYNSSQVAELQTAVDQLVAAPDAGLADVKSKYNILQAITAAVWEEPDAVATADAGLAAVAAQLAKLGTMSAVAIIIAAVSVAVSITAIIAVISWARRRGRQAATQAFDATIVTAANSAAGFPDLTSSPPAASQSAGRHHSSTTQRPNSKGDWRLDDPKAFNSAYSGDKIGSRIGSDPHMQRGGSAPTPVVEVLLAPGAAATTSTSGGIGSCPCPRQQQQIQQLQQRASATLTHLATGGPGLALPRSSAVLSHAPASPGSPVSPHAAARVARLPALPNEVLKRMQNVSGVGGGSSSSSGASGSPKASDASIPQQHQH